MLKFFPRFLYVIAREGEPTPTPTPTPAPPADKMYKQDEVDKLISEQQKKFEKTRSELVGELEALRNRADLTQQERDDLDNRITTLQKEYMTKEEIAKREAEKASKAAKEEMAKVSEERDSWKNRFTEATVSRSITDAAVKFNAFSPKQLISILKPITEFREMLGEDGKPTGEFEPRVNYRDGDKSLDLTVEEAVKRMTEDDEYANLFKASGSGGTGGQNKYEKGGTIDIQKLVRENPEKYRELRQSGKIKYT